jgi:hypothetical protein
MPRFDTSILLAKYPGTDADGRAFRKGERIAYCRRTRRVLTSDPAKVDAIERQQAADAFDMEAEDNMARACGLL